MPRPDHHTPYNPDRVPEREEEVAARFQDLRQSLLPLRELLDKRAAGLRYVPPPKRQAHRETTAQLSQIFGAAQQLYLAQQHLNTAQYQETMAAESGAGLHEAKREIERLQTVERMFDVLLQVVEWPAETLPPHIRKMQAFADRMQAKYPTGLPKLPDDWEAPLLAKRLKEPHRAHEPSVPVPLTFRPPVAPDPTPPCPPPSTT